MGLFRRLFGRERRAQKRTDPSTTTAGAYDPADATILPDWSEYWLTTTREQAGGPTYPYPDPDPAASVDTEPDLAPEPEPAAEPALWPWSGHYAVNLTPPAEPALASYPEVGSADPVAQPVIDHVPGPVQLPDFAGTTASLADLPAPAAASVVPDLPAPAGWTPAPDLPAAAGWDPGAASVPAEVLPADDDLVLDVRDRREPAPVPEPVQPNVVLGFGDGSSQQLAGDDPDARTFHELAAALTAGPRPHR